MSVLKSAGLAKSIDELRRTATGGGRSGRSAMLFVKPDSSIKFRFLTEPTGWMEYQEHYDTERKQFVPAIDNDPLDNHRDEATRKISRRWVANVLNLEDGRVHIVKLTPDQVQRLLARHARYNTVMDRAYEIIRNGGGRDSKYDMDQDDPVQMDLSAAQAKCHDLMDYLLGEVDNYHGTDHQEVYRRGKNSNGNAPAEEPAPAEAAAQKVAQADEDPPWTEADYNDPKLNAAAATPAEMDPTPPPPAEPQGMAEIAAETEAKRLAAVPDPPQEEALDPWEVAKANGQPCAKGAEGTCEICGFDVANCLMKPSS